MQRTLVSVLSLGSLLSLTMPALAQTEASTGKKLQLEEVLVTAQKRVESLSDVPVSVTALDGDKLQKAGISNLSDLSDYTPNFKMVEGGLLPNVYMRGVGSGSNQGFELSVGIFSDGVHLGRPHQTRGAFMDLERVEVLRGPQSILFGKNAIAGALSLISAKPGDEVESHFSGMTGGPDDIQEFNAMVSVPLTDTFGVRAAFRSRDEAGYMFNENPARDRNEPAVEEFSARVTLGWDPTDAIASTLKLEKTNREQRGRQFETTHASALTGCSGENVKLDGIKNADTDEYAEIDNYNATLNVDVDVAGGTFSSVTAATGFDSEDLFDGDSSSFNTVPLLGIEEYDQLSQEFRFTSPGGEFIDYIFGVFYQRGEMVFDESTPLTIRNGALADAGRDPIGCLINMQTNVTADLEKDFYMNSDAWSGFVQLTFNLSETLRTTLGVRYVREEKEGFRELFLYQSGTKNNVDPVTGAILGALNIEAHQLDRIRDVGVTLPSVNVQWDATPDVMTYFTATQGAKSGSFDARNNNASYGPGGGGSNFEFEDELATAYELGAKMTLADGAAELNLALYHVKYEEMQVSVFDGVAGFVVSNAGSALTQGVELDSRWLLSEWFMLSGSLAYLDFEWLDYREGPCIATDDEDICDLSGKENQQTPKWTAALSGTLSYPLSANIMLDFTADASYKDTHFTSGDLDPRGIQEAYTKVNARLAVGETNGRWSVALVGKNLSDEMTIGIGSPTVLDVGGYRGTLEPLRSYYLEGRVRF
ncbi:MULTISPECIES: TonB-dependent receptor [Zhongshania]|uniref:Outer membrane receptor protein involved in Fe transport n=1 Tax=Zhongshania antarctica TaxID=641702 RepID=A0A840R281_9GAMM|nr:MULTISPECIES: TonB-dependent receptor [Zhongshania]MBB5186572.1 outer membrane receptor protein involved in Fe transport [Zhongshania antarctica]